MSYVLWCPAVLYVLVLCRVLPCWPEGPGPVLCYALLAFMFWSSAVWCPAAMHVPGHVPCGALLASVSLFCAVSCPTVLRVLVLFCVFPCFSAYSWFCAI